MSDASVTATELSIGTPSTTNSGCPVPWMVLKPRMTMPLPAPGSPDCDVTSTPGAFCASALTTFTSALFRMSALATVLTAVASFSRVLVVPEPVTTTSVSRSGLVTSVKSCEIVAPAVSVMFAESRR